MTKRMHPIADFMTVMPHAIGREQSIATARQLMREHGIRHLPVLDGGALVGMLTAHDVALERASNGTDAKTIAVQDAMRWTTYAVKPDAPLDQVAAEMAEHRHESAVVVSDGRVVGVFTAVDACRALAQVLRERRAA